MGATFPLALSTAEHFVRILLHLCVARRSVERLLSNELLEKDVTSMVMSIMELLAEVGCPAGAEPLVDAEESCAGAGCGCCC